MTSVLMDLKRVVDFQFFQLFSCVNGSVEFQLPFVWVVISDIFLVLFLLSTYSTMYIYSFYNGKKFF